MPIDFRAFDPHKTVRIYRRNLPHWRQDGATYFVTFRLHDALPQHLVQQLEQIRQALLRAGDRQEDALEADRHYFLAMKKYLDEGLGCCWLGRSEFKELVVGAMRHFDGQRYELGEIAVQSNHAHALVRPLAGFELEDILHGWKGYSGREMNKRMGAGGTVWQDESYDRLVRDTLEFGRTSRYIRNNGKPMDKRETV